jgi:hypothetical protein
LKDCGVLAFGWDSVIRMVTHNGVSADHIDNAIEAVGRVVSATVGSAA